MVKVLCNENTESFLELYKLKQQLKYSSDSFYIDLIYDKELSDGEFYYLYEETINLAYDISNVYPQAKIRINNKKLNDEYYNELRSEFEEFFRQKFC